MPTVRSNSADNTAMLRCICHGDGDQSIAHQFPPSKHSAFNNVIVSLNELWYRLKLGRGINEAFYNQSELGRLAVPHKLLFRIFDMATIANVLYTLHSFTPSTGSKREKHKKKNG